MDGFSIERRPNSVHTVGPDLIPRRWVASPMAWDPGTPSGSGSEEHMESKQGALSIRSILNASLDPYICEMCFVKADFPIG